MITFYTLPGSADVESFSPFCMKVEAYLKLTKTPYKAVRADPRKSPKGKLPFIKDDDGTAVADSSAIITYLEKKLGSPLDGGLDEQARARAHVIQRTLEESFYFVYVWLRWVDDSGWDHSRHFFDGLPVPLRWFVPGLVRKNVAGTTRAQGIGRHSREEIMEFGKRDLSAVTTLLGDGPFFLGERLTTIDLVAYSFLGNLLMTPPESPLKEYVKGQPNLQAFVARVRDRVKEAAAK